MDAVTDREKELIFGEFNNTELAYDKTRTIVDVFKSEALANPSHIALSWQGRKITYKEFDEMTDVLALKLIHMGIKPDDYVALMCDCGVEMIASIYGIIKAGGAYVPISPTFPRDRIEYMLEDCKPKVLLVTDTEYAKGLTLPVVDVSKDAVWSGDKKEINVEINPNNLAYLIYTSGTTGKPKGVMVEHGGVVAMREYLKKLYDVTTDDCVLQFANYIFDASVWEMTMALLTGACLTIASNEIITDIDKFNQFILDEKISISLLPPQFCIQVNPKCMRVLTTGGSAANMELIKKAGNRYINAYGPTENTVVATHWEYERGTDIPKNIPIGKPICNTKIYMLDGERICGIGMPGELCITGDGVARGYLNREELNREKFVKNPFGEGVMYRSGDLAKWQPDGNIEFLGRIDEQVKIRGFRIELGEIENVLRTLDAIVDAAVITGESDSGEKEVYAYYTAERSVSGDEVKSYLRKSLPEYMIPSYVMQIDKIPITRNGKLNKRELPKINNTDGRELILPRTETEEVICALFCEILERQQVSVRDNFFDIGGHSLRATRLVNRIEAETGKKIALKEIFANPTVEQLAQFINGEKIEEYQPIPKAEEKEFYPMSPAQRRMFILSLVSDNQIVYNMPQCFKVEGKLDAERMKAAFEEMVNRHEILRTGFLMDGEKAVQKVYRSVSLDFEVIDQEEEDVIGQVKKFIKPFDLASGNVIRMRIISGTDHAIWFFDMHHIVGDGMSMGTFMDELFAIYNGKTLEPLLCQYKDYSEWMESRSLEGQKQYWVKEFEDVPEVLNMPLDYKRPVNQQYEGARIHRLFMYPVMLKPKRSFRETVIDTKDMLRRVPNHGLGYGLLHTPKELDADIYFNYLGEMKAQKETDNSVSYSTGLNIAADNRLPGNINFNGSVLDDRLYFAITYDIQLYSKEKMQALATAYEKKLNAVIKYCVSRQNSEKTVTDYTGSTLTNDELENINEIYGAVEDIYPLTGLQEGMLFYNLQAQYSTSYVVQSLYNLRGDVKSEYVEQALKLLVRRHDVLRTAIIYHGVARPYQVILGECLAEYKELDVSDMQEAEQETAVEETVSADLNRGFDLEKDSLARMTLIKRGDNWYQLIWNIHHIVMDGWCLSMMFGDFLQYYYKLNDGNAFDTLMEQVIVESKNAPRFSMYMKWLEKQDKEEGLTYWRELLDGYENSARIEPMGSQEPSEKQMERIATVLSKDVTKELNAIAVKNKVTMNTVAECLWGLVLQNYNNSDDVVFGKVVSGRNADIKGIENMVGLFANTIPVRCTKKEGMSFDTLLKDMQLAANTAGNYDYCTLADIQNQSELGQELIKTLFVFENYYVDAEKLQAKDEKLQITVESAREQTNYALTISANYNGETLGFDIMYNPNEYGTYDIQNILERIEFVAKEVVLNKEQNLDAISYITKKEMEIIQYDFNRTNAARSNKTIIDLFEQQVEKTPDNVAVVMGDVKLTYSEFNAKVNALANTLRDMGIKPNDYVALIAERSIEMVLGIFAIVKSAAAYVPIDPAYPKERIEYMLEDCKPKAVLTYEYTLDNSTIPVIDLSEKDVFEGNTNNPEHIVKKDDMLYVIYTSGTTGQPKGVLNMHKGLVNLLQWMQKTYPLNAEDVMMFKTTYIFDVSVSEIFWWSITGAALAILEPEAHKDPYLIAEAVYKHQVTHIDFAPAMLSMFIVSLEKDADAVNKLKSIRYVISAGEALNVEVVNKFYNMLPAAQVKLANLYGPTESTIYVTYYDCHENMSKVPIGKPIANTNMYIVNHGKMCGIGVIGELCIAGVGLANGYLHKEELTEEKFIDNPFGPGKMYRSGDLARWLPDGNIEYYGRMDDQIKIRGFRIELGDIESVIRKVEDITDVAMLVKTLQNGEKVICTYFTSDKEVDIKEFRDKLLQKLPAYMVPQYMMQIDNIPVTSNGKLDRRALPEIKMDNSTKYVEPRNHIEKKLCEIYQEVLGVEKVGIEDNIFDLGGNSLTIIRIVGNAMVEGINITIQNVFMNPTIRALYDYMQKADGQMAPLNAEDYVKYNALLAVKPVTEDVKIEKRHLGNVLITGATGFLGVHIVAALLNGSADKIYCMIRCDNEEHGYQRLKSTFDYFFDGQYEDLFGEKIIVVPGNMTDVDLKDKMPQDVNTIIHSAANTKHFGFYSEFYNINVNGTKNLIAYAKKTGASMTYVSTLSVCDLLHEDADRTEFTERDYYMNQILESPYMRSKFEAEAAIYDAIMDGLDAIVIRTGMLTNRSSDLRTMKDYRSNSFLNSMKSLVKMGTVSESVTHMDIKISPIDEIAEGVIALSCNRADEYHVFHLYHERMIQFEAFRKVFAENGYPVTVVSDQEFGAVVGDNMKSMNSDELYEIVATSHVEQSAKRSEVKNEITSGLLSRIGFTWSSFDEEFIRNWILYYKELNYWDE